MRAGLEDPVRDSQRIFRGVLEAMSRPGRIVSVAEAGAGLGPIHAAARAVCLALVDLETPLWLDEAARTPEVVELLRFHCGCPIVGEPGRACFALVADPARMPDLDAFDAGTAEYPDRSATVIVQASGLAEGAGRRLTGPGIAEATWLAAEGLPPRFWDRVRGNRARFPRGIDLLLTSGPRLAALPRSTRVEG
ncbi:MAG TPA: phosphonate C-P lyase system protein PhnH [Methylomirabilota bacterium]|nr:phosphonate C-P lyase system protein PhnH [Methylomirabilota bacterium]